MITMSQTYRNIWRRRSLATPPVIKDKIEGQNQQEPTDGAETMATKGHTP